MGESPSSGGIEFTRHVPIKTLYFHEAFTNQNPILSRNSRRVRRTHTDTHSSQTPYSHGKAFWRQASTRSGGKYTCLVKARFPDRVRQPDFPARHVPLFKTTCTYVLRHVPLFKTTCTCCVTCTYLRQPVLTCCVMCTYLGPPVLICSSYVHLFKTTCTYLLSHVHLSRIVFSTLMISWRW